MFRLFLVISLFCAQASSATEIVRYANEGSTLPIAAAVEVDNVLYHSGVIPSAANPALARTEQAYWGDTEAQSRSDRSVSCSEGAGNGGCHQTDRFPGWGSNQWRTHGFSGFHASL